MCFLSPSGHVGDFLHLVQGPTTVKQPQLTASNVASHAAENNKRMQTTQTLQKAWWHIW